MIMLKNQLKTIMGIVVILIASISYAKTVTMEASEQSVSYQLNFTNQSYGCATVEIMDNSGNLVTVKTNHGTIGTGTFSTSDSTVTIKVTSLPYFNGVMFNVSDGSYHYLGSKEQSGVTSASISVNVPTDGIIRVYLLFYNPCPIPDEPGCPVPPIFPYSC